MLQGIIGHCRKHNHALFAVPLFLLGFHAAFARPTTHTVDRLTSEQGLSHNTVVTLLQDSRGFVWIGTIDGLNRFDGYSCTVFRNTPSDTNSISSSFIHSIAEDRDSTLWIGTRGGGLNHFDPLTGRFIHYRHDPEDQRSINHNTVGALFIDVSGTLWVGSERGLCRFEQSDGTFTRFTPHMGSGIGVFDVTGIAQHTDSTLWILTQDALFSFSPSTGKFERRARTLPTGKLYIGLVVDSRKNLWVGSRTVGALKIDTKSGAAKQYPAVSANSRSPSSNYITPIFDDENNRVWFTTQNGINIYDPEKDEFAYLKHNEGNPSSISSNDVSALMRDRHGDVWMGTWGKGVDKIVASRLKFPVMTEPRPLRSGFVLSVLEDRDGELFVGTSKGVDKISPDGRYIHLGGDLSTPVIWCMMQDSKEALWFGTSGKGIVILHRDRDAQRSGVRVQSNSILPDSIVRALFQDSGGRIWAGTQTHGAFWYDPAGNKWHKLSFEPIDKNGGADELVWAINEDGKGNLWFGTYRSGLVKFDPRSGSVSRFRASGLDTTSLPVDDVRGITATRSGEVWIATYGGGICRYDPVRNSFTSFTERDGLPNNFTYGILEDEDGDLWVSTNKGLARFSVSAGSFRSYTSRDGLQSDEFNTGAYFKSRTGELFFGGINGLNRFFPATLKANQQIPQVALTSFKIFDKEMLKGKLLSDRDTVLLQHDDNFFSFEFTALDFVDAKRNEYMYKLHGFDKDWVHSGKRRYASYTNLDAGEYILQVRGANSDGVWNEEGVKLHITIVPPYWQTWWFRSAVALIAAVGFASVVRLASTRRLRRQLHEMEKERALQNERERISRDLHDNAGAQLASIISGLEIAEKYVGVSGEKTKDLLDSLRDDARSSMMRLRETIWALKTNAMTIEEFVDAVRTYAERLLKYNCDVRVTVESHLAEGYTFTPNQVLNLYRIVQESITNALKHAGARCICIEIKRVDGSVILRVRDDGRGNAAPPDQFGGKGMLNMRHRANELGGSFRFINAEGGGSIVEVSIPSQS